MKKTVILIEQEDAHRYIKSLLNIRTRLIHAFDQSSDLSFRKWVNKHGEVVDELLEELGYRERITN